MAVGSHFLNGGQERSSYGTGYGCWDMENVDLSDEFKKHYEVWLQKEVFSIRIDWDSLKTVYDIEMDDNNMNRKPHCMANDSSVKLNSTVVIQPPE